MASNDDYRPFSQRSGLAPIPPQLQLGEVSPELRRLLDYGLSLELDRETFSGYPGAYFTKRWSRVSKDLHVRFFGQAASTYQNDARRLRLLLERKVNSDSIGTLFDMVEFFIRHPSCSNDLKADLAEAFATARAAYRIVDGQMVAIGTAEQGQAFLAAIEAAEASGASASRSHLIAAGAELRNGNWPGSVRESIHAVEAMALKLEPGAEKLGPALTKLEKGGHLHSALKAAFGSLFGYASDERGVRHSLVFEDEAKVDEADALFMLGACSSFVSYLISRTPDP